MKKTFNKRNIMATAWKFFRAQMGTFAECLRKAWYNAKAIINAYVESGIEEEVHTHSGWDMLGYMVEHGSKTVFQVKVFDAKTKAHTRVLSYFAKSQTIIAIE